MRSFMYYRKALCAQQENVDQGTLQITVHSKTDNRPVENALVRISYTGDPNSVIEEVRTDSSGNTPVLQLKTPPLEYSLNASEEAQPYAEYSMQIRTIGEFLEIIKPLFGREREKKELAKVFQALRIEVNQEMEALKEMLLAATEALKPGGRLVVITYHSLEDRMVKNIMKTGNVEGKAESDFFGNLQTPFRLVNNKVIVPDQAEIERNPRSRSAKLRIAEKK